MQICFELVFLIDMLTKFLVEYTDDQNYLVRDLFKIAQRYLKEGTFASEFLLLIPFNAIF